MACHGKGQRNLSGMKRIARGAALSFAVALLSLAPAKGLAQKVKKKKGKKGDTEQVDAKKKGGKDKVKTVEEFTKAFRVQEGLFNLYQDTVKGNMYMHVPAEALESEFIYFSQVEDGVVSSGFFRGSYRGSKVVTFHRHFGKLEVHAENTNFHVDPANALSKAADANLNTPILASLKVEAEDSTGVVVSADALFLSENLAMVKPPSRPGRKSALGKLSKDKSKVVAVANYPSNTELSVDYVYDNFNPTVGGPEFKDGRYITVGYRHALLPMPEDGFTPRADDPRIGFFMTEVDDLTGVSATPWKDMIHRWRLEKKDPEAAMSEPVKPITWWIENTTPEEFRPIIKAGVEKWNQAFEPLGFKNAVVVKIQPDDAEWDAGDVRYNVLRWTASPSPPFSGYGPSFVNPRTGEILGADIMLEYGGMVGRLWRAEVFTKAGLIEEAMDEEFAELEHDASARERFAEAMNRCHAGTAMGRNSLLAAAAMRAYNFTDEEHAEFVRQTLHRLVLHEVGHTLGMSHNMHASTMLSPDELKDPDVVAVNGMCNSVMEYPSINFARNPAEQTRFYDDSPGPYDKWVIEYGYSVALDDPGAEAKRLGVILERSTDPLLQFGNDADDMRSTGRGINPDVNIYDLSSDPVAYASERCELVNDLLPSLVENFAPGVDSHHEVLRAYYALTGEYATQLRIMTRQIGGVRYNRATPAQLDGKPPYTPVSEADQKKAMSALRNYAFAPAAFDAQADALAYLQAQRRGFDFGRSSEDPKVHARVKGIQYGALAHLVHPNVLMRIIDSGLYGNTYDLASYMDDLTDMMFQADLRTSVNTYRQGLQLMYTEALIGSLSEKSRLTDVAQSAVLAQLRRIDRQQRDAASPDGLTRAHRAHVRHLIEVALER